MVNLKTIQYRNAFTMIELIFAIVIISIGILALPTILLQDASSQEAALMEEGIMMTTTQTAQVLTHSWDANSSPLGAVLSTSEVVDIPGSVGGALDRVAGTDFRVGHFTDEGLRRRMTPASDPRASMGINGAVSNLGSLNGNVQTVTAADVGAASYKKQYQITTSVSYVNDAADYTGSNIVFNFSTVGGAASTNIKMIQVTTLDTTPGSMGNSIQLTSYSANIGEAEFFKRRY